MAAFRCFPIKTGSTPAFAGNSCRVSTQFFPTLTGDIARQLRRKSPSRSLLLLISILAHSVSGFGQSEPAKAVPKTFWFVTGGYTAAILADDWSTRRNLSWGCPEGWNPGLYGTRPTNARFLGVSFAIEAAQVAMGWRMEKARSRWWRRAGIAVVGEGIADRGHAIAHNLGISQQTCQAVAASEASAEAARNPFIVGSSLPPGKK